MQNPALALTPQGLYDRAWRLINNKYVDETQNQQNWDRWRHKYDDKIKENITKIKEDLRENSCFKKG